MTEHNALKSESIHSPVTDIEPGEMVAGILGVEDVLVDDEGRASCVCCVSHPGRKKQWGLTLLIWKR